MQIELKLCKDFERTLENLREKYGEEFEYLNGIHPSQLDYSEFLNNFTRTQTLADTTVDPNANASYKDIRAFMGEKEKSSNKLFGLSKIFLEIKKKWGLRTAKQWLEQEYTKGFYLNDSTTASYVPYCWANDLTRLAEEGLFFLNGLGGKKYNNLPPKHLTTFLEDVIEFVSFLSNRQSGAVGLPNILVWVYYFWKIDVQNGYYLKDPLTYLRQSCQKLVYRLNQPFLRIDQCAFTNVSIFDREYLKSLFGGLVFPDGSFAIDQIEEIVKIQKVFMDVVSEIRDENMFTFPILTFSLYYKEGKFVDEDFAKWACEHNMKWSDSNFFVSDNIGILSNCPLSEDTKLLYWSDYFNEFKLSPIKEVYYNKEKSQNKTLKVLSNGELINCKINKFELPIEYEIELMNGAKIKTTANHLNKVYNKDYVETKDLTIDDMLPYSLKVYNELSKNMTYEEGKLVGMFLGDGSYRNKTEITFSLNKDTDKTAIEFIKTYCFEKYNATFNEYIGESHISDNNNCININVNSSYLRGLISQFVSGSNALNKKLNLSILNCSVEFRKGIIEGLYITDGGNNNRIYTSSKDMIDSLIVLFSSLGMVTNLTEDNRDGRLGKNTNYVLRYYEPKIRTKLKDVYVIDNDYMWVKIKNIKQVKPTKVSFCLEILDNKEPVFMVGNGIVTHNCRLLSNTQKIDAFINSIGGTALSVGSCRVSTINLVRIAYETINDKEITDRNLSKLEDKYIKILKERVLLDCKALYSMRRILKRNIEKGLLPNYQDGALELDKQFCTIGGIGIYEVLDMFGLINEDELGNKSYSKEGSSFASKILDTINEVKDSFECDYSMNVEMIPAENCAGLICKADNLLFEQDKYFIYSNQWIPLMEKCTIQEKCRVGGELDKKCGGGTIAHIDIENRFPNFETAWDILNYVASKGLIYFAFTTKISVCEDRHSFIGTKNCPICNKPVADTFSRVVGFYTPVSSYQKIRKEEWAKRKWYNVLEKDSMFS